MKIRVCVYGRSYHRWPWVKVDVDLRAQVDKSAKYGYTECLSEYLRAWRPENLIWPKVHSMDMESASQNIWRQDRQQIWTNANREFMHIWKRWFLFKETIYGKNAPHFYGKMNLKFSTFLRWQKVRCIRLVEGAVSVCAAENVVACNQFSHQICELGKTQSIRHQTRARYLQIL